MTTRSRIQLTYHSSLSQTYRSLRWIPSLCSVSNKTSDVIASVLNILCARNSKFNRAWLCFQARKTCTTCCWIQGALWAQAKCVIMYHSNLFLVRTIFYLSFFFVSLFIDFNIGISAAESYTSLYQLGDALQYQASDPDILYSLLRFTLSLKKLLG